MKKIKTSLKIIISLTIFAVLTGPAGADVIFDKEITKEKVRSSSELKEIRDLLRGEYIQDEIIVKFKNSEKPFEKIKVSKDKLSKKLAEYLENEDVEYAEPNYIAHTFWSPNDSYYNYQWHLHGPDEGGINTEAAWDLLGAPGLPGQGVTVAIIDTGIAYENYGSTYQQASDLTGTCFANGYDFVNNDSHPNDDNGHGTHVAGTVAQNTNNSLGVAGIAFKSCLMPIKVLNSGGSGNYADIANGVYFAANNGAKVINLSLGGSSPSNTLEQALSYAYNNGVTIVAAAGNDSSSLISYPAAYNDYVIAVGATRYDKTLAYYSNYGQDLDVVAPGGDLKVDQNNDGYKDGVLQQTFTKRGWRIEWGYYFMAGTSMASPHVAGTAALVISNGKATAPDDVRAALETTAKNLGPAGWDSTYGWGLIDAAAALSYSPGPVDNPPTINITSPLNGAKVSGLVVIEATASDDNDVSKVDFYLDENLIGTDTTNPYNLDWNSASVTDGNYIIKATATDTGSQTANDSVNIIIDNVNDAPIANAGPDQSAYINEIVSFDGSSSYDSDGSITSYEWNFGDGTTASGAVIVHAYSQAGNYTATLTVTDNGGLTDADTALVVISEKPTAPTAVVNISLSKEDRFRRWRVNALISINDKNGQPINGAVVEGAWSDLYNRNVSDSTNDSGEVNFRTSWQRNSGTITFTVNQITKDGQTYILEGETTDSISN